MDGGAGPGVASGGGGDYQSRIFGIMRDAAVSASSTSLDFKVRYLVYLVISNTLCDS